jgi:hypothetical protein
VLVLLTGENFFFLKQIDGLLSVRSVIQGLGCGMEENLDLG